MTEETKLELETITAFTIMDSIGLVNAIGLYNFLEQLLTNNKKELTKEEIEAMKVLHENWNL